MLSKYISKQFSNLFNGYTQAFNKQYNRKGSLFIRPFKRIIVNDERYRNKLVHYIHHNPIAANLCKMPGDWPLLIRQNSIEKRYFFKVA